MSNLSLNIHTSVSTSFFAPLSCVQVLICLRLEDNEYITSFSSRLRLRAPIASESFSFMVSFLGAFFFGSANFTFFPPCACFRKFSSDFVCPFSCVHTLDFFEPEDRIAFGPFWVPVSAPSRRARSLCRLVHPLSFASFALVFLD